MDTTQGGGEERKGRKRKKWKGQKISRNKQVWGGGERKRKYFRKAEQSKDILNKHQDAIEKMVRKMADRPVCGFRWKQHHENHKQLCCVLQAQLHIGYMSHHSKRLASRHSVSLMLIVRIGALRTTSCGQDLQTNKQNQHARLGGSRCTLFIVHSQSTGTYNLTSLWASVPHTLYISLYPWHKV